jgi:hypothetical protein
MGMYRESSVAPSPRGASTYDRRDDHMQVISDFVDLCEDHGLDPVEALKTLNAQDWDAGKEDVWHPTDEQLKAINCSLREIVGEPTTEQIETIFRSVM